MLILDHIDAQGVNAQSGFFSIGFPAVTAFNGLAHSILRQFSELVGASYQPARFAVVVHDSSVRLLGKYASKPTQKRYVHFDRNAPTGERAHLHFTPAGEAMPQGDVVFSLVIDFAADDRAAAALAKPQITRQLLQPRALGGVAASVRRVTWAAKPIQAMRELGSGWVFIDRSEELRGTADSDPLDVLLDKLSRNVGDGWRRLAPTQIGWRGLGPGGFRQGARDEETEHFFVEPVIGLGEFVRKHVALNEFQDLSGLFWRPRIDQTTKHFYCVGDEAPAPTASSPGN